MTAETFRLDIQTYIDDWLELANDMSGNNDSAVEVLSDLLNFDKIETGRLSLEFSIVSIFAVVGDVYKTFVAQAREKSIDLKLTGKLWEAGSTPEERMEFSGRGLVGDATRIAQVLRNLLSNALKFTPESGTVTVQGNWGHIYIYIYIYLHTTNS